MPVGDNQTVRALSGKYIRPDDLAPHQAVQLGAFSAIRASECPWVSSAKYAASAGLKLTSVDGSKYTASDGVGWLKSFVRENVVKTDETASGGSKLLVPDHHNS